MASTYSLADHQVALLARLCDVPMAVIRELAWSDFRNLHEALRWSYD